MPQTRGIIIGILLSIIANIFTGSSQVIQKQALAKVAKLKGSRFSSKEWILGISLGYSGDIINFIAYSHTNPALLSPLGIISIFTVIIQLGL